MRITKSCALFFATSLYSTGLVCAFGATESNKTVSSPKSGRTASPVNRSAAPGAAALPHSAHHHEVVPRHARLEEVTVTALRKNSNQQKTAVSVTALSPTMIMRQNIQSLDQLQYRVPNLVVPPRGLVPNTLSYYIRGIGEPDSLQNQDVGIYVDDVYIARPTGATFQLSDLESINVLRGPQGTLFGRNSSAGALVINTTTPTDHVHTFAEGGVGNYNNYQFRLGASGPIKTGVLDGGISVLYHTQDGFVRNEYLRKSVGNLDVFALRAKLRWTPMERLEFILSADYDRDYSDPVPVLPRVKGVSTQHYVNYDNLAIWNKLNAGGVSLKGTYSINRYSKIRSITSYRAFDDPGVFDQDGTSLNEEITVTHHRDFDYTQELQYQYDRSRLHFAVGGFLYHDRFASSRYNAVGIGNSFVPQVGLEISNSYSLYGQGTYDILPNLHLTFGSRYTWEDHSFEYTSATKGVPWHVNNPPHHWASYTPKWEFLTISIVMRLFMGVGPSVIKRAALMIVRPLLLQPRRHSRRKLLQHTRLASRLIGSIIGSVPTCPCFIMTSETIRRLLTIRAQVSVSGLILATRIPKGLS